MSSDRDDIIILIDENGNEVEAEYIDTIEYQNNEYVVLLPKEEHSHADGEECDCDEEEVVILKVEKGADNNEETFVAIESEEEQDAVFEIFTQRMDEVEYDEEDDENDDEDDEDDNDSDDVEEDE
jgi:uncharacterized protein YrzB (UPF0473 family)